MRPPMTRTLEPLTIGKVDSDLLDRYCPKVDVLIDGLVISGAIVYAGSVVNIISLELSDRLGFILEPATLTALKLANNSVIKPKGELKNVPITVANKTIQVDFYVMRMYAENWGYSILLGRPWLRLSNYTVDIPARVLIFGRGRERTIVDNYPEVPQTERAPIPSSEWEEVTSSEEDGESTTSEDEPDLRSVLDIEWNTPKDRPPKVRDVDICLINLGTLEEPKNIKIGASLGIEEKEEYKWLCRKYQHIFAWDYSDLKGIPHYLVTHTIPLKEGAKHI
ncbi:hypothetical protein O6H91_08G097700 [Diphasiastrum complanatum]|uniref:Uncharacterized protein n=1 Tax=Diphasiastrum complanatum TaxID=34168 RepID=A0ACC2D089_DIPCM|nr:hypothetical protein O6H91_08G097700 [Diphasiastrum complanatum]